MALLKVQVFTKNNEHQKAYFDLSGPIGSRGGGDKAVYQINCYPVNNSCIYTGLDSDLSDG